MNRKTKIKIIEELFDNYFCVHPEKRAFDKRGSCTYLDIDTGNMCAVGMCMTDEKNNEYQTFRGGVFTLTNFLEDSSMSLDDVLKEQYRGHGVTFWGELQALHDNNIFWWADGLNVEGLGYLNKLKTKYAGQ